MKGHRIGRYNLMFPLQPLKDQYFFIDGILDLFASVKLSHKNLGIFSQLEMKSFKNEYLCS